MAWIKEKTRLNKETGRKEGYWVVEWRNEEGRVKSKSLGFVGKKEAERLLKLFEGRQAGGRPVEPELPPSAPSSSARVTTILRNFLTDSFLPVMQRDLAAKTHEGHVRSANALNARLGDLPLDEISYALVDGYVSARKRDGRRSRTIILELLTLNRALQHAHDLGVLVAVPRLPHLADRDRQPHRFLTPEESEALLAALRPLDEQPHRVTRGAPPVTRDRLSYLAIAMALNTGMRRGEILSRRWPDVRFKDGLHGAIRVGPQPLIGFKVKTRDERVVPLSPELRAELEAEWKRLGEPRDGWVFPSPTDPERPRDNFKRALALACKRAGLPPIHPHGLRHTWASRLAMKGVDRKTLMDVGGWKTGRMLDEVYAHVTSSHAAEVMARMGIAATAKTTDVATPESEVHAAPAERRAESESAPPSERPRRRL